MAVRGRTGITACAVAVAALLTGGCDQAEPPPVVTTAPVFRDLADGNIVAVLPRTLAPDAFPALAKARCGARPACSVHAWMAPSELPTAFPLTEAQIITRAYTYIGNRKTGFELSQWNCLMFNRPNRAQCMPDLDD